MQNSKLIPALIVLLLTHSALAVSIADVTRLDGQRTNVIVGMGLVVGLKGTGDGPAYQPTMKALANQLTHFGNPTTTADLSNAANTAIVNVYVTLPACGVRNGDHLDVHLMSVGTATSLYGGTLYLTSILGPTCKPYTPHDGQGNALPPIPFAVANGPVELQDPTVPTTGIVKAGAVMEVDLPTHPVDRTGRFTLVIDSTIASYAVAGSIAKLINESNENGETIAAATDAKSVVVQIPDSQRSNSASFIATVLALPFHDRAIHGVIIPKSPSVKADAPPADGASSFIGQWWIAGCLMLAGLLRPRTSLTNGQVYL